jgi:hypothetical protein
MLTDNLEKTKNALAHSMVSVSQFLVQKLILLPEHPQFGSMLLLFIPEYNNFTEMDAFWVRYAKVISKDAIQKCFQM